jgi:hypothetical protein
MLHVQAGAEKSQFLDLRARAFLQDDGDDESYSFVNQEMDIYDNNVGVK